MNKELIAVTLVAGLAITAISVLSLETLSADNLAAVSYTTSAPTQSITQFSYVISTRDSTGKYSYVNRSLSANEAEVKTLSNGNSYIINTGTNPFVAVNPYLYPTTKPVSGIHVPYTTGGVTYYLPNISNVGRMYVTKKDGTLGRVLMINSIPTGGTAISTCPTTPSLNNVSTPCRPTATTQITSGSDECLETSSEYTGAPKEKCKEKPKKKCEIFLGNQRVQFLLKDFDEAKRDKDVGRLREIQKELLAIEANGDKNELCIGLKIGWQF